MDHLHLPVCASISLHSNQLLTTFSSPSWCVLPFLACKCIAYTFLPQHVCRSLFCVRILITFLPPFDPQFVRSSIFCTEILCLSPGCLFLTISMCVNPFLALRSSAHHGLAFNSQDVCKPLSQTQIVHCSSHPRLFSLVASTDIHFLVFKSTTHPILDHIV